MSRLAKALPYVAIAVLLPLLAVSRYNASTSAERWGADLERLRVADSALRVLKADWEELALQYANARVSWQADSARWVALVRRARARVETLPPLPGDTVTVERIVVVSDSLPPPTLEDILRQAEGTIASCATALGTCEQQTANARQQAALLQQQADIWRRKAQPSLWEQLKQIPGRALTTSAIYGAGYFTCRAIR